MSWFGLLRTSVLLGDLMDGQQLADPAQPQCGGASTPMRAVQLRAALDAEPRWQQYVKERLEPRNAQENVFAWKCGRPTVHEPGGQARQWPGTSRSVCRVPSLACNWCVLVCRWAWQQFSLQRLGTGIISSPRGFRAQPAAGAGAAAGAPLLPTQSNLTHPSAG